MIEGGHPGREIAQAATRRERGAGRQGSGRASPVDLAGRFWDASEFIQKRGGGESMHGNAQGRAAHRHARGPIRDSEACVRPHSSRSWA